MRIAIIGTGITGLGAAWALSQRHEITVYEEADRIGGHANTVDIDTTTGRLPVDTGFIVFNDRSYPNLTALFAALDVPVKNSDMSFSVSIRDGALEYSGESLTSLFAQRRNLFRPRHYQMIADILRFYKASTRMVANDAVPDGSLAELLAEGRYGNAFIYDHILPMGAAIWSADIREMLDFPAATFLRFFNNHGLLAVNDRPQWMTVDGGSRAYVDRISRPFADRIRTRTPVRGVRRTDDGVIIYTDGDEPELYDQVVFATHADTTLSILQDPDPLETDILARFPFQANTAILHTDTGLMPRRRRAWSSWNYMANDDVTRGSPVSVTYWMNRLQSLQCPEPVFLSLNPVTPPGEESILRTFRYDHPVFTGEAIAAQSRISQLQGRRGIWVCGAWCGYGFHEDGLSSAMAVTTALGVAPPWTITEMSTAAANTRPSTPVDAAFATGDLVAAE